MFTILLPFVYPFFWRPSWSRFPRTHFSVRGRAGFPISGTNVSRLAWDCARPRAQLRPGLGSELGLAWAGVPLAPGPAFGQGQACPALHPGLAWLGFSMGLATAWLDFGPCGGCAWVWLWLGAGFALGAVQARPFRRPSGAKIIMFERFGALRAQTSLIVKRFGALRAQELLTVERFGALRAHKSFAFERFSALWPKNNVLSSVSAPFGCTQIGRAHV